MSHPQLKVAAQIATIAQSAAAVVAVAGGVLWSIVWSRELAPRANVTQSVTHRQLTNEWKWVFVLVRISNAGSTALEINRPLVRVEQIRPLSSLVAARLDAGERPEAHEGETVAAWPLADHEWRTERQVLIEPGETDELTYDFFVPAALLTVKVYSYFELDEEGVGRGISVSTIHELQDDDSR